MRKLRRADHTATAIAAAILTNAIATVAQVEAIHQLTLAQAMLRAIRPKAVRPSANPGAI